MKDIKYKAKEYRSEAIYKQAEEDIKILAESLLPNGYQIQVEECDVESENKFTKRYKFLAKIKPDHDSPHFIAYSRTKPGVYAKIVEIMFGRPVYPIVK